MSGFVVVSTAESRAAAFAEDEAAAAVVQGLVEAAGYVPPRVTAEDERIWAAVEDVARG